MSEGPYVARRHTMSDRRRIGGTITHGGPNQFICGFYPRDNHKGCTGCDGRGWYVKGQQTIRSPAGAVR